MNTIYLCDDLKLQKMAYQNNLQKNRFFSTTELLQNFVCPYVRNSGEINFKELQQKFHEILFS